MTRQTVLFRGTLLLTLFAVVAPVQGQVAQGTLCDGPSCVKKATDRPAHRSCDDVEEPAPKQTATPACDQPPAGLPHHTIDRSCDLACDGPCEERCVDTSERGWLSDIFLSPGRQDDACCEWYVPNVIGDSFGVPRVGNRGQQYINFPTHIHKVADNNNVRPYDRVFFAYSLYENAPTLLGVANSQVTVLEDTDISEFRLGAEKTLLHGLISANVIVPYYHTVAFQQQVTTMGAEDYEFGNLAFGLKLLVADTQSFAASVGVQAEAPTARDQGFRTVSGATQLIPNEAWYLSPYAGMLWAPTERLFTQMFASYRARTGANSVAPGATLITQDLAMLDAATGYWLRRCPAQGHRGQGLTGIAPVMELHYLTTTEDDVVRGSASTLTQDIYGRRDQLNLTAGTVFEFNARHTVAVGLSVPLRDNPYPGGAPTDRSFDWDLAVQFNLYR